MTDFFHFLISNQEGAVFEVGSDFLSIYSIFLLMMCANLPLLWNVTSVS